MTSGWLSEAIFKDVNVQMMSSSMHFHSKQDMTSTSLYPGPVIYAGPGFYPNVYSNTQWCY